MGVIRSSNSFGKRDCDVTRPNSLGSRFGRWWRIDTSLPDGANFDGLLANSVSGNSSIAGCIDVEPKCTAFDTIGAPGGSILGAVCSINLASPVVLLMKESANASSWRLKPGPKSSISLPDEPDFPFLSSIFGLFDAELGLLTGSLFLPTNFGLLEAELELLSGLARFLSPEFFDEHVLLELLDVLELLEESDELELLELVLADRLRFFRR